MYSQKPNVTKLTDSSGGTGDNTLAAIEGSYTQATIRNNFADLAKKLNEVIDILNSINNSGFEMTTQGRR